MYKNFIDIHAHILPQMDNGARTIRQSKEMLRLCHDDGIQTIIATPHYIHTRVRNRTILIKREQQMQALRALVKKDAISLLCGFEVHADSLLLERTSFGALCLAGTPWILLERSYIDTDDLLHDILDELLKQGLRPIIAHPERYVDFFDDFDEMQQFASRGVQFQLTSDAVAGDEGTDIQQWCMRAIELNLAHYVATGMHSPNQNRPRMNAAAQAIENTLGYDIMFQVMYRNPERLLGLRT